MFKAIDKITNEVVIVKEIDTTTHKHLSGREFDKKVDKDLKFKSSK